MSNEIESVKPVLSVIVDDGDWIINSTGPTGKAAVQAVLPLAASARKVTIITDGDMKVMKRNGAAQPAQLSPDAARKAQEAFRLSQLKNPSANAFDAAVNAVDIQDQFAADLEAGRTGEIATGEVPGPTPGPSEPVQIPGKRKAQIFQDAAAPLAPELAEQEMARLLQEAAQAEADAAKVAEDRRFQAQQAVQAQAEPTDVPEATAKPRKRERTLATTGRPCTRCGGAGQIMGDAGFTGHCPVCMGAGQVKSWDRAIRR